MEGARFGQFTNLCLIIARHSSVSLRQLHRIRRIAPLHHHSLEEIAAQTAVDRFQTGVEIGHAQFPHPGLTAAGAGRSRETIAIRPWTGARFRQARRGTPAAPRNWASRIQGSSPGRRADPRPIDDGAPTLRNRPTRGPPQSTPAADPTPARIHAQWSAALRAGSTSLRWACARAPASRCIWVPPTTGRLSWERVRVFRHGWDARDRWEEIPERGRRNGRHVYQADLPRLLLPWGWSEGGFHDASANTSPPPNPSVHLAAAIVAPEVATLSTKNTGSFTQNPARSNL